MTAEMVISSQAFGDEGRFRDYLVTEYAPSGVEVRNTQTG